jgi:hypothetical protein
LEAVAKLSCGRPTARTCSFRPADYKGEHLVEHTERKKNIGERWAEQSGGKALFLWAVKNDKHGRAVRRHLEDKLAKS